MDKDTRLSPSGSSPTVLGGNLTTQRNRRNPRRYGFGSACQSCKSRKIRCTGEQPSCRACVRSGTHCVWPLNNLKNSMRNRDRDRKRDHELRQAGHRIQHLESLLRESQIPADGSSPQPGVSSHDDTDGLSAQEEVEAVEAGTVSPPASYTPHARPSTARLSSSDTYGVPASSIWSQVGVGENGAIIYNGPTSRFHAGPVAENDEVVETSEDLTEAKAKRETASHIDYLHAQYDLLDSVWQPLVKSKSMEAFGTTNEIGSYLLDLYWTWLHPLHNCIYRPVFIMDMALNGPNYSDFLLMAIFALSARHLSRQDGESTGVAMGEQFFARAKLLLVDEMDSSEPRIPTIQGLLILGGRQCAIGKSSQGWLFTGMAIRMMMDIGIHLNANKIAELERLTPADIEIRKRLYNSAYIWDKTLSLALGRPPSLVGQPYGPDEILDRYDDNTEWSPGSAADFTSCAYSPVLMHNTATFSGFCELHKITTDMMLLFYNPGRSDKLYPEIQNISARFRQWYYKLSDALKLDDPSSMKQCPPPHIASLNFLYHALHILLIRPLLHSSDAAIRTQSMETCVRHSKSIHAIHDLYGQSFPHRLMTYQVSYCIYTAATVDALEMKRSEASARVGAARRLGMAVKILQEEARHTPGSGRSLDTIRRQLSVWDRRPKAKVVWNDTQGAPNTATLDPMSQGDLGDATRPGDPVHGLPAGRTEDEQHAAAAMQAMQGMQSPMLYDQRHGLPSVSQEGISSTCLGFQSLYGVGVLDTGAGFHPEAFPWDMSENFINSYPQAYHTGFGSG